MASNRRIHPRHPMSWVLVLGLALWTASGCSVGDDRETLSAATSSCMQCHNGSQHSDYTGPGIQNPHPFGDAASSSMTCVQCHGGNNQGETKEQSHIPVHPDIGDRERRRTNRFSHFNRLTLTGIDKLGDYTVDGVDYTALDYLQWLNPGDLRVVTEGRSCGECHEGHSECVNQSLLATEAGVFGGAMFSVGHGNQVPSNVNLHQDTAADIAFRAVTDPEYSATSLVGPVPEVVEFPVFSSRAQGANQPGQIFRNPDYDHPNLDGDVDAQGRIIDGSELAHLYQEQVAFTCGDCHLGSAGANNRYGDFRSSGCTACHMPYALSGRSGSRDPNVDKTEPVDPDDLDPPEQAHIRSHRIVSVARTLANGTQVQGMDDHTCAGCHQGSNRTVMQYWGIRLDQNQDVRRGRQYPHNPVSHETTRFDTRLFDPEVGNNTFNGRNHNQYLLREDYDGDGRDDTPADVHHEAGMGCIDCHGSVDLHGGDFSNPTDNRIQSRMEQHVTIQCTDCHGNASTYATTAAGVDYSGNSKTLAVDSSGRPLRHVERDGAGHFWLTSKLTGNRHYVVQTRDVTVDLGRNHPVEGTPLYSPKASYAMGRADGNAATGIGPEQDGATPTANFSHSDNMSCQACHAAWTNTCMGCHLWGEYDEGNNFSNITGERIVFEEDEADFVYQSPVPFQLGVGPRGTIEQVSPNTKMFFRWRDRNGDYGNIFAFSDRTGKGADPGNPYGAMGHNALAAHSIRGRVDADDEGPRYCVACHMTTQGLTDYGAIYDTFRSQMAANDFTNLDYATIAAHIGQNPGNQMNSPIWVHMVAGLGSGLFLFDDQGRPMNPVDNSPQRQGTFDPVTQTFQVPSAIFNPAAVAFNLDRIVNGAGTAMASNSHALIGPPTSLRDGPGNNANRAGPLGATLLELLTNPNTGLVLDGWLDADGGIRGSAQVRVPD